jgi:type II restriction/modification system DNA methylase subunit YeeA
VLDKDLADLIAELARKLAVYEVATPQLEPEFARDLLKRLYQNLVPSDLRHRLGEFYTPDWLANHLLDEVGLSLKVIHKLGEENSLKPLEIRILDPACGSGTFLMLYIARLRRYAEEHYLTDIILKYILNNVVGYDLNPLAVLTARTNYLLTIADLLAYGTGTIELPIYLADSIMVQRQASLEGDVYILRTSAGDFEVPISIVEKGLLVNILAEISRCLESKYRVEDFKKRMELVYRLNPGEISSMSKLYEKLLKLEEEGKNKVWVAIIRNAFAPILKGKFDYVVGNPPWVNWENLPESYREASKSLWEKYGLAKIKGKTGLGKVKRDLAMLFLSRCFDLYLKENGKLGFLMPFTIFKTQAGAGFRVFIASNTKIHVIHDLVTLYPFEGATNRTSAIVVEKVNEKSLMEVSKENKARVRHVVWVNPSKKPVPTDKPLEEVLKETRRYNIIMVPLEPNKPESPWMQVTPKVLDDVRKLLTGTPYYEAHAGVYVGLNQVYYVQVKGKTQDGKLIITNPPEPGQKKKVKQVETVIESDLIYPLIRGKDIKKWYVEFKDRYIILPVNAEGKDISTADMKVKYPNAYSYFYNFFNELINREGEPYKSKLEPYKKLTLNVAEKIAPPFYWVFNVKPSLAPYKVVWKRIAGAITGKAVSFVCAVIEAIDGQPVIPDDGTIMIKANTSDEAYYIAGLLNSLIVRAIIASYTYELRQETHIADVIKIPRFDLNNDLHKKIAELSKKAHELAKCIYAKKKPEYCLGIDAQKELRQVEKELDLAVAQLFGLTEKDLEEFKRLMAILTGEEISYEEEIKLPEEPKVSVLNTLLPPDTSSYIEIDVVNPSGEEIDIEYELPWGKNSFVIVEGKHKIDTPPLQPGKYSGVIKYRWRGIEKSIEVVIEVSERPGPKRQRIMLDFD